MNCSLALVGKPNVGKSTLLNALLNKPLGIVSPKPQTTVYSVRGIAKIGSRKILCVDTPGIHRWIYQERGRKMNRLAHSAMQSHDLVLCLFQAGSWDADDEKIQNCLADITAPKIAIITQIDTVDQDALQTTLAKLDQSLYQGIVPISALKNKFMDILAGTILCLIPPVKSLHEEEHEHSDAFLAQEMLREQIMNQLHQEIPYAVEIEIFSCNRTSARLVVHANLIIRKQNHKKVIVGHGGERIKTIGMLARKRLSDLLGIGVELRLWVQYKERPQVRDLVE